MKREKDQKEERESPEFEDRSRRRRKWRNLLQNAGLICFATDGDELLHEIFRNWKTGTAWRPSVPFNRINPFHNVLCIYIHVTPVLPVFLESLALLRQYQMRQTINIPCPNFYLSL